MKFENTKVMNFEGAFRGMRNPLNSWDKSDSFFGITNEYSAWDEEIASRWCEAAGYSDPSLSNEGCSLEDIDAYQKLLEENTEWMRTEGKIDGTGDYLAAFIGPKDMDLAQRLIKAGPQDRKFLRQIFISVDITAPLYWFKEFDTYKVATVSNSTSTMHKLATTPITLDCFERDDFSNVIYYENEAELAENDTQTFSEFLVEQLEWLRLKYLETKDKRYWKELVRWLPEGWLQTRTWTCNYETLRSMYAARKNHKLTEWHTFCKWVESLPYAYELIVS